MNCSACGRPLPAEATACPNCGTLASALYTRSGSAPNAYTTVPESQGSKPQLSPYPTMQGPYNAPPPPAAGYASNPYEVAVSRTQPLPPKQGSRRGMLVGVIVGLVVLLVLGGLVAALRPRTNSSGLSQPQSTAGPSLLTATASRNPYPPYAGTLVLNDHLRDNTAGYQWSEGKQSGNAICGFSGGAYHMSLSRSGFDYCGPQANGLAFSNLAFEANLTIVQGDYAGIWFRLDKTQNTRYLLIITPDGLCILATDGNDAVTPLRQDRPVALRPGQQTNLLAVVAIGDTITWYVNNQLVASIKDTSYQQGQIGVFAQGVTGGFNVIVSDVRVWKL